jgi:hypothetical protein
MMIVDVCESREPWRCSVILGGSGGLFRGCVFNVVGKGMDRHVEDEWYLLRRGTNGGRRVSWRGTWRGGGGGGGGKLLDGSECGQRERPSTHSILYPW